MNLLFGMVRLDPRAREPLALPAPVAAALASEAGTPARLETLDLALIHLGGPQATLVRRGPRTALLWGHPRWPGSGQDKTHGDTPQQIAARLAQAEPDAGAALLQRLEGDYLAVLIDGGRGQVLLASDRIGSRPLFHARTGDLLLFSNRLQPLAEHPDIGRALDPQALYDYLYFHFIPSPKTIYRNVRRLVPGQSLTFGARGSPSIQARPLQYVETGEFDFAAARTELTQRLYNVVEQAGGGHRDCGTFLSGGVDSSTVTGIAARLRETAVDAFSIGFDQEGYDEIGYAKTTADHFGAHHHVYYVTPDDIAHALPRLCGYADAPFGNASIVPTYYCARLAAESGIRTLLAGDGGDELFGGNYRYAKQLLFERYDRLPGWLRGGLIEPLLAAWPKPLQRGPVAKVASYVRQARMPMPDRMQSYNLLEWFGAERVLTPDFLAQVTTDAPLGMLRDSYWQAQAESTLNRMLAMDMKFTIADNDLVKVNTACDLAGVEVRYPLLDDRIVDFSLRLPVEQKVHGQRLRYFFKQAMEGFLPAATLTKSKHGFGLPFGHWIEASPLLQQLVGDSLASLRERGLIQPGFIDQLLDVHLKEHAGYFGTMIWIFVALELWLQGHQASP